MVVGRIKKVVGRTNSIKFWKVQENLFEVRVSHVRKVNLHVLEVYHVLEFFLRFFLDNLIVFIIVILTLEKGTSEIDLFWISEFQKEALKLHHIDMITLKPLNKTWKSVHQVY